MSNASAALGSIAVAAEHELRVEATRAPAAATLALFGAACIVCAACRVLCGGRRRSRKQHYERALTNEVLDDDFADDEELQWHEPSRQQQPQRQSMKQPRPSRAAKTRPVSSRELAQLTGASVEEAGSEDEVETEAPRRPRRDEQKADKVERPMTFRTALPTPKPACYAMIQAAPAAAPVVRSGLYSKSATANRCDTTCCEGPNNTPAGESQLSTTRSTGGRRRNV